MSNAIAFSGFKIELKKNLFRELNAFRQADFTPEGFGGGTCFGESYVYGNALRWH